MKSYAENSYNDFAIMEVYNMKKLLISLAALALLAGCGQGADSTKGAAGPGSEDPADSTSDIISGLSPYKDPVMIQVNLGNGMGTLAFAEEGKTPEFEEGFPVQSMVNTVERNSVVELDARPDEEYQFLKWTKNDEFYSYDSRITVTVPEDVEYKAHFISTLGYEGPAVDSIDKAKTLGDILALGYLQYGNSEKEFNYVFELDNTIYSVKADLPEGAGEKLFDIDYSDPDRNKKTCEILAPLEIRDVVNLTEKILPQEELDKLIGKTGEELTEDGWVCNGWFLEQNEFFMEKGPFRYIMIMEGEQGSSANDDGAEIIRNMTVKSVRYDGLGDALDLSY